MQFTKITAVLAIAASASAMAVRNDGGIPVCKTKDGKCHPSSGTDDCNSKGGESFKCTTIGLLNLLDCVSLLNGNHITIPVSIDIL